MSGVASALQLSFSQLNMKGRFLDREFAKKHVNPITIKFFMRAGGSIRLVARRSLKKARRKKLSELSRQQKTNFLTAMKLYRAGKRKERRQLKKGVWVEGSTASKPVLPEATAKKGRPPLLHSKADNGQSPLKHRLWFALTQDKASVVIGPAAIGRNRSNIKRGGLSSLRELEQQHPFMEPAYKVIEPRLPEYLQNSVGG